MRPSDADLLEIIEYLDGRLSGEQVMAFELRLAADPELAAERDAFERMDHAQRLAAAARPRSRRDRPVPFLWTGRGRALLAVAASVVVLLAGRWLLTPRPAQPGARITVLASAATLIEHNARLGLDEQERRQVPPGFGLRAGGGELEPVGIEEYLALTSVPGQQRVTEALERADTAATAAHFVVPIRPARDCSVLVVVGAPAGLARAYPSGYGWSATTGRLSAGRDHVLPAPNVARVSDGEVDRVVYEPGFLVPRGAGELQVLVGLRDAPFDEDLRIALDAALEQAADAEDGLRWLEANGFDVHSMRVHEE